MSKKKSAGDSPATKMSLEEIKAHNASIKEAIDLNLKYQKEANAALEKRISDLRSALLK